ncbi:hypothetical protein LIA77_06426 [Sarocladium implicatum]|nr:hypothetical protein LIA77_06426 [Sarocladium implicatum]
MASLQVAKPSKPSAKHRVPGYLGGRASGAVAGTTAAGSPSVDDGLAGWLDERTDTFVTYHIAKRLDASITDRPVRCDRSYLRVDAGARVTDKQKKKRR